MGSILKSVKNFFSEFKTFAVRGNWIELAVAVLIGASFNQVTTALANNILTPFIGVLVGGIDFSKYAVHISKNVTIQYGILIQAVVNFVITALFLFFLVKGINRLARQRKEEEKEEEKQEDSPEVKILKEIRDELKRQA